MQGSVPVAEMGYYDPPMDFRNKRRASLSESIKGIIKTVVRVCAQISDSTNF